MVGQVLGGLTGIAQGVIGGRARRREQAAAQQEMNMNKARFENLDTSNVYKDMQNVYEDLTVNQQAAQFQSEQEQQGLSNIMGQMSGAAGGSGIASLAQSLAGQQSQNLRRASIDIGQQERSNQMVERQQAANIDLYERKGELTSRDAEQEKVSTLLGMSQQRLSYANQAREDATQSLVGGVGQLAGAAAGIVGGLPSMQDNPIGKILSS